MSRRLPPLNSFQAFEAAARHLSFTSAGAELHVSKAAISHHVKTLEQYLDVKLFQRSGRRLTLTRAAEACFPELKRGFDCLAAARCQLTEANKRKNLTISAPPSFAQKWLVPRLAEFRASYPEFDLRVCAEVAADPAHDDADIAVVSAPEPQPGTTIEPLLREQIAPACSPALLSAARPLSSPRDLGWYPLIHVDGPECGQSEPRWREWLCAAGAPELDATPRLRFSSWNLAIEAAIEGNGVVLTGSALIERDLAAGRLVRPFDLGGDGADVSRSYWLVTNNEIAARPGVNAFRTWLHARANGDGDANGNGHARGNGQARGNGEVNGNGRVGGNGQANGNGRARGNGQARGNGRPKGQA